MSDPHLSRVDPTVVAAGGGCAGCADSTLTPTSTC